jgi:16S rRNA processing protein RimM
MEREAFFYLGRILRSLGGKGLLVAYFDVDDPARYRDLDHVFIGIEHERIPYMIKSLELRPKKQAVIRFEDVNSASDAEPFIGCRLFLPSSFLPELKGKKFYYHEITGFDVTDERYGPVGKVESVIDLPLQALLQVRKEGREILIPLSDEILVKVDRRKKEIRVRTPEGLLEIYL